MPSFAFPMLFMASFNVLSGYFLFGGGFHWFNFHKFLDTDPSSDLIKPSQKIQIFVFHSRADSAQWCFFFLTNLSHHSFERV